MSLRCAGCLPKGKEGLVFSQIQQLRWQKVKHHVVQSGFELRCARLLRSCSLLHQRAPSESERPPLDRRPTLLGRIRAGSPSGTTHPHFYQLPVSSGHPPHSHRLEHLTLSLLLRLPPVSFSVLLIEDFCFLQ